MNFKWSKIAPKVSNGEIDIDGLLSTFDDDINKISSIADTAFSQNFASISHPRNAQSLVINDEDNDEEDGDEVQLIHEVDNSGGVAVQALKDDFGLLIKGSDMVRSRYEKLVQSYRELEQKVVDLEEKNDILEEHIQTQEIVQNTQPNTVGVAPVKQRRLLPQSNSSASRGNDVRKALLAIDDEYDAISMDNFLRKDVYATIRLWIQKHLPFNIEIRQIEARFGSSVTSYFIFYRFVFLQISGIAFLSLVFAYFHLVQLLSAWEWTLLFGNGSTYLPTFMMFSSFQPVEGFMYTLLVVLHMLVFIVTVIEKVLREDRLRNELNELDAENNFPFSREVFNAWDYTMITKPAVDNYSGSLMQTYMLLLDESKLVEMRKNRTNLVIAKLYLRRVLAFVVYAGVQGGAFWGIFTLSVNASVIATTLNHIPLLRLLANLIAPITVSVINMIMPTLLGMITAFECWDLPSTVVNMQLFRMYTSNLLNTFILATSYILLADPFLLATNNLLSIRNSLLVAQPSQKCRIDDTASKLFLLSLTTFASTLVSFVATPTALYIYSVLVKSQFVKPEFDVASSMVDLFSFVIILMLLSPFAPLMMVFAPLYVFCAIKWQSYWLLRLYSKPLRPWKAQKAGSVFSAFYLVTILLVCIPVTVYFLSSKTFPKSCDIQDNYVDLCSGPVSAAGVCPTNSMSPYFAAYGTSDDYPASICKFKCGPFIHYENHFEALREMINSVEGVRLLWAILFDYPYLPWTGFIAALISTAMLWNYLQVQRESSGHKERELEAQIMALTIEKQKHEKQLSRLKTINDAPASAAAASLSAATAVVAATEMAREK